MSKENCCRCGYAHQSGITPCKGEIREALWTLVEGRNFADTRVLRYFLTFLVELELNGAGPDAFTEKALWLDFDGIRHPEKISNFDVHVHRVIAVRMLRIRCRNEGWLAGTGASSTVEICFSKGSNQPQFRYRWARP